MPPARESSGTQAATVGTEHVLVSPTTAKSRVLVVDVAALVAGDLVELRVKTRALAGGTDRTVYTAAYAGPVTDPMVVSPPIPIVDGGTFTLKQTLGSGRSFPWAVLTLD